MPKVDEVGIVANGIGFAVPAPGASAVYLGLDPGVSGGLAGIGPGGVSAIKMPPDESSIWAWIHAMVGDDWYLDSPPVYAVLEQVQGWIGGRGQEGRAQGGQPGSAMFKFGQSYGTLRGMLTAAGLIEGTNYWTIVPKVWQRKLGVKPRDAKGGESKEDYKRRLRALAQDLMGILFPQEVAPTLGTADALLLAYYCKLIVEESR